LLEDIPRDLQNMFDRDNWDIGEFRAQKKKLVEKIADKELEQQIKTDEYNFRKDGTYVEDHETDL